MVGNIVKYALVALGGGVVAWNAIAMVGTYSATYVDVPKGELYLPQVSSVILGTALAALALSK